MLVIRVERLKIYANIRHYQRRGRGAYSFAETERQEKKKIKRMDYADYPFYFYFFFNLYNIVQKESLVAKYTVLQRF